MLFRSHQRCAASLSPQSARKGVLISVALWVLFDFLTLSTGLYAKAFVSAPEAALAYPALAGQVMPIFWKGLFVVTLLATVMSTLDSYSFISAATIGYDILGPIGRKYFPGRKFDGKALTRIGLVVSAVVAVTLAISINSIIEILYLTASVAVPGLLIPLLTAYSKKFRLQRAGLISIMSVAPAVSLIWIILRKTGAEGITSIDFVTGLIKTLEPMVPGILLSLILFVIFIRKTGSA